MPPLSRSWSAALVVLAVGSILPPQVRAGEAIQFSNARSRVDPTAKSKLPGDLETERLGRMSPLEFLPSSEGSRRDPALTRKERNAAKERANWMVLEKGQLDARDEEKRASGMREATFEKEVDRKDYFFSPLNEKDGIKHSPFGNSSRDRSEPGANGKDLPDMGSKPDETPDTRRSAVLGKDGQPLGEHTAKELDLKDLLNTGKANSLAPNADRTALMWKDVLGSIGDTGRRREEGSTADSFRGTVASGSTKSEASFNFRNDLSARASVSGRGGMLDSTRSLNMAAPLSAPPAAPRAADAAFSRGQSIYATPGQFGSSAGGAGADPYEAARSQPQRPSAGSYAIPSRPGYGR